MAHVQKFTKAACGHLLKHYERAMDEKGDYIKFNNQSIDTNLSHLNYNLAPDRDISQVEFIKQRCSEVKCLNRKDVNVMCSWVVTKPESIEPEREREFFEQSYKFLENRYGKENIISAYVHNDETTPHMHFAFVPVVHDPRIDIDKVSAKIKVSKTDLQTFHSDLEKHLEQYFGREVGIINEATKDGNKAIEELKRSSAIEAIENLNKIKQETQQTEAELINIKNELNALQPIKKSLDELNAIETKKVPLTNNILMNKQDSEDIISLAKQTPVLIKENEELKNENEKLKEENKNMFKRANKNDKERADWNYKYFDLKKDFDKISNWLKSKGVDVKQIISSKQQSSERSQD